MQVRAVSAAAKEAKQIDSQAVAKVCASAAFSLSGYEEGDFTSSSDSYSALRTACHLQAKALESVLKDVNARFGKGSIMKMSGVQTKV